MKLREEQVERVKAVLHQRIVDRVPAAYLTNEALLGGLAFHVDERVIIPRSYFVELIPELAKRLGGADKVRRAVDVCTGSGCLAILLILSNPPYEPSGHCDRLAPEFRREPRLALDGGTDGLDIIRKLLRQARERLTPNGLVTIEVGGLRMAMEAAFPDLPLEWLHTADGSDCVCLIRAQDLARCRTV